MVGAEVSVEEVVVTAVVVEATVAVEAMVAVEDMEEVAEVEEECASTSKKAPAPMAITAGLSMSNGFSGLASHPSAKVAFDFDISNRLWYVKYLLLEKGNITFNFIYTENFIYKLKDFLEISDASYCSLP